MCEKTKCYLFFRSLLLTRLRFLVSAERVYPRAVKPTLKLQVKAWLLGGKARAFTDSTHFSKPTAIYLRKCPRGWILDYKHGYPGKEFFECPKAYDESASCPCDMVDGRETRTSSGSTSKKEAPPDGSSNLIVFV